MSPQTMRLPARITNGSSSAPTIALKFHTPMSSGIAAVAVHDLWLAVNPAAKSSLARGIAQSAAGAVRSLGSFAEFADIDIDD